jgi:hypothetical protein
MYREHIPGYFFFVEKIVQVVLDTYSSNELE